MDIILASASPRRRELLEQIGIKFRVIVSDAPEECSAVKPQLLVQELSKLKAMAVYNEIAGKADRNKSGKSDSGDNVEKVQNCIIIGADTVVAHGDRILGKPESEAQAKEFLSMLQDNVHQVYTGVTLLKCDGKRGVTDTKTFYEETRVIFGKMSGAEIEEYVASGDCMDKAGAYGIQGMCARYIKGIDGDYNNVVGLPVAHLYAEIKEWL
jgi:septum formation protein